MQSKIGPMTSQQCLAVRRHLEYETDKSHVSEQQNCFLLSWNTVAKWWVLISSQLVKNPDGRKCCHFYFNDLPNHLQCCLHPGKGEQESTKNCEGNLPENGPYCLHACFIDENSATGSWPWKAGCAIPGWEAASKQQLHNRTSEPKFLVKTLLSLQPVFVCV